MREMKRLLTPSGSVHCLLVVGAIWSGCFLLVERCLIVFQREPFNSPENVALRSAVRNWSVAGMVFVVVGLIMTIRSRKGVSDG